MNWYLTVLSLICAFSVGFMIFALTRGHKEPTGFILPSFETAAQSGMPDVKDSSWTRVYKDGMSFTAYVCGKVTVNNGWADVYFTNDSKNKVWLKLRVTDENGNILAESGLIRLGEYVKSIKFNIVPNDRIKIKLKIMSYEPDTYYNAGAVSLNTTIGG